MQDTQSTAGALIALAGVLLTLIVQIYLARWQDKRESAREDRVDDKTRTREDLDHDSLLLIVDSLRRRNGQLEARVIGLQLALDDCRKGKNSSAGI